MADTVSVFAEDGLDGVECPCCGLEFDSDEWEVLEYGGDAWGGLATYSCPTDDCDGQVWVNF